jgi:hypothetical protein
MVRAEEHPKHPKHTLVLVTGGVCAGYVGRIDRYTSKRVWLLLVEDDEGDVVPGRVRQLTTPNNILLLTPGNARAEPFPELYHPRRQGLVDLVFAYAIEATDFFREVDAFMDDVKSKYNDV